MGRRIRVRPWTTIGFPAAGDFYEQQGVERVRGHVSGVDVAKRTLTVEGHEPISFDALLLATGAEPMRLAFAGADLSHVHYLRSLADSRAIIQAAAQAKRAVVIGASLIGLDHSTDGCCSSGA